MSSNSSNSNLDNAFVPQEGQEVIISSEASEYDQQSNELLAAGHPAEDEDDESDQIDVDTDDNNRSIPLMKQPSLHPVSSNAMVVTREYIARNWLTRYTGRPLDYFGSEPFILLCNFTKYVKLFADMFGVQANLDFPMQTASAGGITIINFGMGSPAAATCCDLLSAIKPKGVLFLGKVGGLKKSTKVGSLILPLAAIRGEGTSNDYFDPSVPALPSFALQKAVSTVLKNYGNCDYYTGTVYTTNRRLWEFDEEFKQRLRNTKALAIDMETATILICSFWNKISAGALLLVSDTPMLETGIKTLASDALVTKHYVDNHLLLGIESLKYLQASGHSVKHLQF